MRSSHRKNSTPKITEHHLFQLYEHLNHSYFNNAVYVQRVRFGKFVRDLDRGRVAFGLFVYDTDTGGADLNEIIVNKYLLLPSLLSVYPWLTEAVLYHEMCHAMLVLAKCPHRHGHYVCKDHGPEFQELMRQHPKAVDLNRVLYSQQVMETILKELYRDTVLCVKRKVLKRKLKS